jgi:hypothetical protein
MVSSSTTMAVKGTRTTAGSDRETISTTRIETRVWACSSGAHSMKHGHLMVKGHDGHVEPALWEGVGEKAVVFDNDQIWTLQLLCN